MALETKVFFMESEGLHCQAPSIAKALYPQKKRKNVFSMPIV